MSVAGQETRLAGLGGLSIDLGSLVFVIGFSAEAAWDRGDFEMVEAEEVLL